MENREGFLAEIRARNYIHHGSYSKTDLLKVLETIVTNWRDKPFHIKLTKFSRRFEPQGIVTEQNRVINIMNGETISTGGI